MKSRNGAAGRAIAQRRRECTRKYMSTVSQRSKHLQHCIFLKGNDYSLSPCQGLGQLRPPQAPINHCHHRDAGLLNPLLRHQQAGQQLMHLRQA